MLKALLKSDGGLILVYSQSTGTIWLADSQDGRARLGVGYSGHGAFINRPERETEVGLGPIPRGVWKMGGAYDHPRLGPTAIPLVPFGHTAHGRTEFFIHGDNSRRDGSASRGCIILDRSTRILIAALGDRAINCLEVVA